MDAFTIARPDSRGNGQYVKKTSRQRERSMLQKTQPDVAGLVIRDGARLSIGPEEARSILETCVFTGQRPTDPANLRAHAMDMQRGLFRAGSQIIFARLPDNNLILVNGYHRLNAVIEADTVMEFQVMIEPVANHDEVRNLYCSIDTNMRKRSDPEISRAAGLSEEIGVRQSLVSAALNAVAIIASGLRVLRLVDRPAEVLTAYGRKDAVKEWAAELRVYSEVTQGATKTLRAKLINQGIMAIALVTLRYQPDKAIDFWTGVAENDGLRIGDARKALVTALVEGSHRGQQEAGLLYVSVAWNAWFTNRQLSILRLYDTSLCQPMGTPFAPPAKRKYERRDNA